MLLKPFTEILKKSLKVIGFTHLFIKKSNKLRYFNMTSYSVKLINGNKRERREYYRPHVL